MEWKQLQAIIPGADPKEWDQHPNGKGWVKKSANAEPACYIEGVVYGNAQVYGDAHVSGNAQVYGDAWVFNPLYIAGSLHPVTACAYGQLQIGCIGKSLTWWKENRVRAGEENGYTPAQIEEYGLYVEMAEKWMKLHGVLGEDENAKA